MNPLMRLLIPTALGFAAAAVNWMVIESRTASRPFVLIREGVRAGEVIEGSTLGRIDLPGDPGTLGKSLIPFSERDLVVGTRAQRDLFPGDFLLWQDAKRPDSNIPAEPDERILPIDIGGLAVETSLIFPGTQVDFWIAPGTVDEAGRQAPVDTNQSKYSLIGPFRILSVGSRFAAPVAGAEPEANGSRGNERVISVAVKVLPDNGYDAPSRQLLDAHAQRRIMALALRPRTGDANRSNPAAPTVKAE